MFAFFKKFFGLPTEAEQAAAKSVSVSSSAEAGIAEAGKVEVKTKRTKDTKGKFIADDPRTPHNEAWTTGKSPAKKPKAETKKTTKSKKSK